MPRRGENIRKRKDGRWEGRYKKKNSNQIKAKYISVYGKSYKEVKQKLSELKKNLEAPASFKKNEVTFSEVLNLWMKSNRLKHKGSTENKYAYLIETHIRPQLGNYNISEITSSIINEYTYEKTKKGRIDGSGGLSPSYVRSLTTIIHSSLQYAFNENLCQPFNIKLIQPSSTKNSLTILNRNEQKLLEDRLLSNMTNTKLGVYISLCTGLRIGEICALKWGDIDFEEKIIHVRSTVSRVKNNENTGQKTKLCIDKPKTKSSNRDIPISSKLYPILSGMKDCTLNKFIVADSINFVSPRTFEYRYHRLLKECGVRDVNYHVLRHTFATRCIEAGVDIKTLSEILGHSNVSITLNTYVHLSMEIKRMQLEKLN